MTDAFVALQNGVPENRIVQFFYNIGGYVVHPTGITAYLAANSSPIFVPMSGAKPTVFLGYQYPLKLSPQLTVEDIVTGAQTTGFVNGYFSRKAFTAFPTDPGGTLIGAFKHAWMNAGEPATRVLAIDVAGTIFDTETGLELERSGPYFGSVANLTYSVSKDGRAMILEIDPTLTDPPARNVKRFEIDYGSGSDGTVTSSNIAEPSTYGTRTLDEVTDVVSTPGGSGGLSYDSTESITSLFIRDATYSLTYGLDASGNTIATTLVEATREESDIEASASFVAVSLAAPNLYTGEADAHSVITYADTMTITVPGGASKTFSTRARAFDDVLHVERVDSLIPPANTTADQVTDWTEDQTDSDLFGVLGILYSDPTNSVLIYEYRTTLTTNTINIVGHWSSANGGDMTQTAEGAVTFAREVGILYGDQQRILFSESTTSSTPGSHNKTGWRSGIVSDDAYTTSPSVPAFSAPTTQHTETHDSDPITVNLGYFKKLKWVTDEDVPKRDTPMNSGFVDGRAVNSDAIMFCRDVSALSGIYANDHRYWMAVRSPQQWLFAVRRIRDINGNVINDLQLYEGKLDEAALRQHYIDYLLEAALAAAVPEAPLITALQAGNFGTYDAGLSSISRIPMI